MRDYASRVPGSACCCQRHNSNFSVKTWGVLGQRPATNNAAVSAGLLSGQMHFQVVFSAARPRRIFHSRQAVVRRLA